MGKANYKTGISFANYKELTKTISEIPYSTQEAIEKATKELAVNKSRGRPKIKKAVTQIYGIPPADMKEESDKARAVYDGKTQIGKYKVTAWAIKYNGRLLTPLHFKMLPETRPAKPKYLIKATIIKKQRKAFKKMPAFLAPASGSSTIIPFFRHKGDMTYPSRGRYNGAKSKRTGALLKREKVTPIKTISVPQMISNKNVKDIYTPELQEQLKQRIEHYMKREMDKSKRAAKKTGKLLKK